MFQGGVDERGGAIDLLVARVESAPVDDGRDGGRCVVENIIEGEGCDGRDSFDEALEGEPGHAHLSCAPDVIAAVVSVRAHDVVEWSSDVNKTEGQGLDAIEHAEPDEGIVLDADGAFSACESSLHVLVCGLEELARVGRVERMADAAFPAVETFKAFVAAWSVGDAFLDTSHIHAEVMEEAGDEAGSAGRHSSDHDERAIGVVRHVSSIGPGDAWRSNGDRYRVILVRRGGWRGDDRW